MASVILLPLRGFLSFSGSIWCYHGERKGEGDPQSEQGASLCPSTRAFPARQGDVRSGPSCDRDPPAPPSLVPPRHLPIAFTGCDALRENARSRHSGAPLVPYVLGETGQERHVDRLVKLISLGKKGTVAPRRRDSGSGSPCLGESALQALTPVPAPEQLLESSLGNGSGND